jgi:putative heme-binding domain-containing protein
MAKLTTFLLFLVALASCVMEPVDSAGPSTGEQNASETTATTDRKVVTLNGFKAEKLFEVPKDTMGSWVGMTSDDKGRLITSDQYGDLYRVTVGNNVNVEPLNTKIQGAHGLLYAFDSLYVLVSQKYETRGLYRLTDTTGDDRFDKEELLQAFNADGEHGLHSLVLGPDKQSIYIVGGNTARLPEGMSDAGPAKAWQEDLLLPRMWDARGHAKGRLAPGGFIARCDKNGKHLELIATGFRNQFDAAFTASGELFTFDSDMEWDIGMPWYRPTRVLHVVSGADFGWRSGSGKWPVYYPDTLPSVVDVGLSSPTGLTNGLGAKFPAKYQKAIFINDWTYGTMYAVHLTADGASYKATKEEFITGMPLPLTDVIIHPQDGALYFLVGGRKGQSALYKVSYTGNKSTKPTTPSKMNTAARQRVKLEALHQSGVGSSAIDTAWPHLAHNDRFIRHAARVAIEKQPTKRWANKALAAKNTNTIIESMVALARVGDKTLQSSILKKLIAVDTESLSKEQFLATLRAYQLAFTRMGEPEKGVKQKVIKALNPLYPAVDNSLDRELSQILLYLNAPGAISKTVKLLVSAKSDSEHLLDESVLARNEGYRKAADARKSAEPNTQQIAMAFVLRTINTGWTAQDRETYFAWFETANTWKGGMSLVKFIDNIRRDALASISDEIVRFKLDKLSQKNTQVTRTIVPPTGPGRQWTVDEAVLAVEKNLQGRNFKQGENLFYATACASCHRFSGQGGGIGPDITGSANRYTLRDMFEHIIKPSKVISDQYGIERIVKKDGTEIIGRIGAEEDGVLYIMTNPFDPDSTLHIAVDEIKSKEPSQLSPMPPGLINSLNTNELSDLIAFIFSQGNRKHQYFKKNKASDIFDGKTLNGWEGDKDLWSVKDGVIVGTTHHKKLKKNSFLIWQGGQVKDFHLSFEVKLEGNNSGVQYRAEKMNEWPWRLKGYQADIHPRPDYTAMLYSEATGRGIVATRGNKVVVDEATGKPEVVGKISDMTKLDLSQWHHMEIIAKGNRLVHKVDGVVAVDITDNHKEKILEGLIGLQLHAGEPMKVWFRNLRLKSL